MACLGSLARSRLGQLRHRVWLVDNGSTDDTVASVRAAFRDVEVLELGVNRGFAAAMNAGVEAALAEGADWVLLLNNDTVVDPSLVATLWSAAAAAPDVGLAAPAIYRFDAPDAIWPSAGRRRWWTLAARERPDRSAGDGRGGGNQDVDWANGCCLLLRREAWRSLGRLDEGYVFYYEDHDLCLRARAAGWRILQVPAARVWHRVSASAGPGSPLQHYLLARSSVRFYARHMTGARRWLVLPYRAGSFARTAARALVGGRPENLVAYREGLRDGLAELAGKRVDRSMAWTTRRYAPRR
jgi:GT2 family glycosyltransferase